MHRYFLAVVLAALPIAVSAAATYAPSAVVANPTAVDGQTITVTGTVSNFKSQSTAMGQWSGFQLCDAKCIVVIDKTNQTHANGSSTTVTGVFHATFKGPHKTWTDALLIG